MIQHKKEGDNLKEEGKRATVEGNVEIEAARRDPKTHF